MNIPREIQDFAGQLTTWRRDIHRHPELGFKEQRTSQFVAEQLAAAGCEVHTGIGGTGVVGVLRAGRGNRSIGLRADMDALPIAEENVFEHCSTNDGVMHACGHDGHTTMLRGGDAYNVIPQSAAIGGTARAFSRAGLELIEAEMRRVAEGVAGAHGVSAQVDYRVTFAPTVNSEREAALACDAAAELVGEEHVDRDHHLLSGSEDFSFMLESRPGAFILIGNGEDAAPVHSPRYEFDDRILPLGSALYVRVAERELGRGVD